MKPYKGTITDCVLDNGVGGFYCQNDRIPSNILKFDVNKQNKYHETEKPVALIEYLIQLFTMPVQKSPMRYGAFVYSFWNIKSFNLEKSFSDIHLHISC